MAKYDISIRFRFEFSHRLLKHKGKCNNIHGHSGIAWIHFTGDVHPASGMIADFHPIKKSIQEWVDVNWDHALILNVEDKELLNVLEPMPLRIFKTLGDPTMETLARVLNDLVVNSILKPTGLESLTVSRVRIQETENAYVDFADEDDAKIEALRMGGQEDVLDARIRDIPPGMVQIASGEIVPVTEAYMLQGQWKKRSTGPTRLDNQ